MRRRALACGLAALPLAGCLRIGPDQLARDEIDYSAALGRSEKQQTLLNVVRLRYGDAPTFVDLTQIISGYQSQRNVTGSFELFPRDEPNTYLGGGGSVQLQESPTFTYAPVEGEQFANDVLRPLRPEAVLPLALGGLPVDVLFRLVVQSINGLQNSTLGHEGYAPGSPDFFRLLRDMRILQIAGLLSLRLDAGKPGAKTPTAPTMSGVFFRTRDPALAAVRAETMRLLRLDADGNAFTISYAGEWLGPHQIGILTRSVLEVMFQIASGIDVPPADIADGRTVPTVHLPPGEARQVIVVHSGPQPPDHSFVAVRYEGRWFWIADTDFDSKVAFTIVQVVMALARTATAPGAVVTIPTG